MQNVSVKYRFMILVNNNVVLLYLLDFFPVVAGIFGDGGRDFGIRNGHVLHDVYGSTERPCRVHTVQQSQGTENRPNT